MFHFTMQNHTEIRYGRADIPCFSNQFTSYFRLDTSAWSLWCLFCTALLAVVIIITQQEGNAAAYITDSVNTPANVNLAVGGVSDRVAWAYPDVTAFNHKEMSFRSMIMAVAA